MAKKKMGAPTKVSEEVIRKLEQTAALDATVGEMCFYAGISVTTYYNIINTNKKLFDSLQALRQKPILKARQTFVNALDDPKYALEYLERKCGDEFVKKQKMEHATEPEQFDKILDSIKKALSGEKIK